MAAGQYTLKRTQLRDYSCLRLLRQLKYLLFQGVTVNSSTNYFLEYVPTKWVINAWGLLLVQRHYFVVTNLIWHCVCVFACMTKKTQLEAYSNPP